MPAPIDTCDYLRFPDERYADLSWSQPLFNNLGLGLGTDTHVKTNSMDQTSSGPIPIRRNNQYGDSSAMPISSKFRRESFAQSMNGNGGLSWAGVSVGSWVRDDILMAGTSPAVNQPTSFHSSSYLPKLEAQFFKEFLCCGKTLPGLHDLLGHYEQFHAHQNPPNMANGGGLQDDGGYPQRQQQHLQIPDRNNDMIRIHLDSPHR